MEKIRIVNRPAFEIIGKKVWIEGPDNEQFGRFWGQCRADGLLDLFQEIKNQSGQFSGPQTGSAVLGVSRVEKDPAHRAFHYMIAIEMPGGYIPPVDLEHYLVPAARWAVFPCRGPIPEALVEAEMFAFGQWLPGSGYKHAPAPEMEVYPPRDDPTYCEFWLPIEAA